MTSKENTDMAINIHFGFLSGSYLTLILILRLCTVSTYAAYASEIPATIPISTRRKDSN
jgi:hypothetical protein